MTWKKGQTGEIIATPAQMERFGINENFNAVRSDPRNAAYLVPLANPEAEESAQVFADTVYSCIAYDNNGFDSAEDSDWCFEQCLIDGRKYECEPEYAAIFENMAAVKEPEPTPEEPRRKLLQ
jgi:hypothetical protein